MIRNQSIGVVESNQPRDQQPLLLSVPGHNNLPQHLVVRDLERVDRNEVTIENQRRHRIAFYSKADGAGGIRTPFGWRRPYGFGSQLVKVSNFLGILAGSGRTNGKNGNGNKISRP